MTYEEFSNLISGKWEEIVSAQCQLPGCDRVETYKKKSILNNFKRNNNTFICRSCAYTDEGRAKISKATSYKRSTATKAAMSVGRKKFFQTPEGGLAKIKLSKLATENSVKLDKSKRKVIYKSAKNNDVRLCFSSFEYIACEDFLEKDPNVLSYETQVPYLAESGKWRSLDFLVIYTDGRKKVIEVKPKKRLTEKQHKTQIKESRANAIDNDLEFEVWTEKHLNITNCKEATRRADEYRKQHYLIDYAAYRKQRDKLRTKRHYDKKSQDKVVFLCEFCNAYHCRPRYLYEKKMKEKGRYICINENGFLTGSRPKDHRKNPLAPEGKKKCNGICGQVKPLSDFSTNGVDLQGNPKYCSQCKVCRSEKGKAKYAKKGSKPKILEGPRKGSQYKGVSFKSNKGKYCARICIPEEKHLGFFDTAQEAAENYDYHALKMFGRGGCYLNFPNKDYSNFVPKVKGENNEP